jgi:hypothetical protein
MSTINFFQELHNFDGTALQEGEQVVLIEQSGQITRQVLQKGRALTLKAACVNAIGGRYEGEQLTPEQHIDRFLLAKRIQQSNGEGVDLSSEEISLIKQLLAKAGYGPVVVGQACQLLEGKVS